MPDIGNDHHQVYASTYPDHRLHNPEHEFDYLRFCSFRKKINRQFKITLLDENYMDSQKQRSKILQSRFPVD